MMREEEEKDLSVAPRRGGKQAAAKGDLFAGKVEG